MLSYRLRSPLVALMLSLSLSAATFAQTPAPTPAPNPAQQDATRPPGTEQRQSVPEQARPVPSDPTAPPSSQLPSPQAPPGASLPPAAPIVSPNLQRQRVTPNTATPTLTPTPATPTEIPETMGEPMFPQTEPHPVPPVPSLTRLGVSSDNQLALSLNEAIRRALANNNDIEVARNDVRFAETQLRVLQGVFDPIISFTPQINRSISPQSSSLGGSNKAGTVSQTDFTLNPTVTRQFSTGGGNYQLFFNNLRRNTSSTFSQFSTFYSSSAGITFTQPLLRDRSIDRNRQQIRIQRKRLEQSDADFRRTTIQVISNVQRAYWDLVFALKDEQNQVANYNLARENFRNTEARVAAGASAPLERAEVQTELSNRESAILLASQTVSVAENNLKQLILKDPIAPEWSAALMPTDQPTFDETPVNLTEALTEARANRPELRRLHLQQEINGIDIQYFKNQVRPRIDIQSTLSTTGLAGTPIVATGTAGVSGSQVPLILGDPSTSSSAFLLSQVNQLRSSLGLQPAIVPTVTTQTSGPPSNLVGGYGKDLSNLFGFSTRNIVVGVAIQIPLHNTTAKAELAGARIQQDQLVASIRSQEQGVEVEVRNAAQSVETARRRVLSARDARQNAELQLAGEQRLYQVGRSTTFLLFQRENALVNARNQELRAQTDYNKALADLQRATSTTLRTNNVIVESPIAPCSN